MSSSRFDVQRSERRIVGVEKEWSSSVDEGCDDVERVRRGGGRAEGWVEGGEVREGEEVKETC